MQMSRRKWVTVAIATGALIGSAGIAGAVTGTSPTTTPTGSSATTHHSDTDPAHEAAESPQRQADEAAGKAGFGGPDGHSNTDPAHEAGESAAHRADEARHDAGLSNGGSGTTSTSDGQ